MDSVMVYANNFVSSTFSQFMEFIRSLDIGIIVGLIASTSVFKAILNNTKPHLLTDATVTGFLFVMGIIAGFFVAPDRTAGEIFHYALYYAGGSTILFMIYKHLILNTLISKLFPDSKVTQAAKGILTSVNESLPKP
jgi:hypothetical protein